MRAALAVPPSRAQAVTVSGLRRYDGLKSFATFTNASQARTWFVANSPAHWTRRLEAEYSRSVFNDPAFHIEVDLSGLVRGDYATRWAANVAAVTADILTPDEIRGQEGVGPLPAAVVTLPVL